MDTENDILVNLLPEPLIVRTRGRERSKIVHTGASRRPKKEYHEAKVMSLSTENPTSLTEAMNSKEMEKWIDAMNKMK